jgi:hypothetical protein
MRTPSEAMRQERTTAELGDRDWSRFAVLLVDDQRDCWSGLIEPTFPHVRSSSLTTGLAMPLPGHGPGHDCRAPAPQPFRGT